MHTTLISGTDELSWIDYSRDVLLTILLPKPMFYAKSKRIRKQVSRTRMKLKPYIFKTDIKFYPGQNVARILVHV